MMRRAAKTRRPALLVLPYVSLCQEKVLKPDSQRSLAGRSLMSSNTAAL